MAEARVAAVPGSIGSAPALVRVRKAFFQTARSRPAEAPRRAMEEEGDHCEA